MNLRLLDVGLAAADGGRRVVAQHGQDGLDVLAGAQRVGLEVGALTEVVADVEAADADAVLAAAGRVGHLEVAEDAVAPQVGDLELLLGGAAAAQVDLFLAEHRALPVRSPWSAAWAAPA